MGDNTEQTTLAGNIKTKVVNMNGEYGDDVVRIDRSTQFGNKFRLKKDGGEYSREESIQAYRKWFLNKIKSDVNFRKSVEELRGETLGCWCKPQPCHGDVIVEYLDVQSGEQN